MQNINLFHNPSARFRNLPRSLSLLNRRRSPAPSWMANITILEPESTFVLRWNSIFLITCMITLFLDPLYFFVPTICGPAYICGNFYLAVVVTVLRLCSDAFYLFHIITKFRTAYVHRDSRTAFGKGELVKDPVKIAKRYLKSDFIIDACATFPLPQTIIWFIGPMFRESSASTGHTLYLFVLCQYIPKMMIMFPLNNKIINTTGVVARTAWSGAAYNMLLFVLASHILGATWYLWSLERLQTCWAIECEKEAGSCQPDYFSNSSENNTKRMDWLNKTHVLVNCDPGNKQLEFDFGMFADAFKDDVPYASLPAIYFYCLWWGMKSLSSYGQNLQSSTYVGETLFSIFICVMGLGLFSHLIGQVQNYLQSIMVRIEEWRIKRRDTEEWMNHRQLPEELKERIRRFVQYKWLATRGVDEECILQSLPLDLRREIQRHLCLGLVRRVPFFEQMDFQLLDAICERLVSSLNTKDTYIIREGDPVSEMIFIIRGQLESSTTFGGRSGFYNSITLRSGDFCGEELLTWALLPTCSQNLPSSTRTVKAVTEVEAFALRADDLKFVAVQFKRLQSKRLQHAFRYYSHQWRMWGTCFIQAAWRRYRKKKMAEELAKQENYWYYYYTQQGGDMDKDSGTDNQPLLVRYEDDGTITSTSEDSSGNNPQPFGATILASRFAANTRRGATQKVKIVDPSDESLKMPKMFKPQDPDFTADM